LTDAAFPKDIAAERGRQEIQAPVSSTRPLMITELVAAA
jgi:hypothetical protein